MRTVFDVLYIFKNSIKSLNRHTPPESPGWASNCSLALVIFSVAACSALAPSAKHNTSGEVGA